MNDKARPAAKKRSGSTSKSSKASSAKSTAAAKNKTTTKSAPKTKATAAPKTKAAAPKKTTSKSTASKPRATAASSRSSGSSKSTGSSRTSTSSSRSRSTASKSASSTKAAPKRRAASTPSRAAKRPATLEKPVRRLDDEMPDTEEFDSDEFDEEDEDDEPMASSATKPAASPPAQPSGPPVATELKIARGAMWIQAAMMLVGLVLLFTAGGGPNDLNSRLEAHQTAGRLAPEVATAAEDLDNGGQNDLADIIDEKGAATVEDVQTIKDSPAAERRASARGAFRTIGGIVLFAFMSLLAFGGLQVGKAKWRIGILVMEAILLLPTILGLANGNFNLSPATLVPLLALTTIVLLFTPNASRSFIHTKEPTLNDASRFDIRKMGSID